MRILVCGDREWTDQTMIKWILEAFPRDTVVIHGAAKGADSLAGKVARDLGMEVEAYPAQWKTFGKGAGPIRNQQMLDKGKPDRVYAFHNNIHQSKGTKDMVARAVRSHKLTELISSGGRRIIYAPNH